MKAKVKVLIFILSFQFFISNEIWGQNTQSDAFFHYQTTPELRGADNGISYGFTFDLFDESIGNGFEFDNFGNELGNNSLEFGDFDMVADDVPLGKGLLILGCLALMWFFLKTTRLQDYKRLIIRSYVETRQ